LLIFKQQLAPLKNDQDSGGLPPIVRPS